MTLMLKKMLRKNINLFRQYGALKPFYFYFRIALWYLLHILAGKRSVYKKVSVNDYSMFIDLKDSGISKALFVYGTRENDQMYVLKNVLKSGATVLDIGANIGYYVIAESKLIGPAGKIIAYEPSSDNCRLLEKNMGLNEISGMVRFNEAAVSDRSGTAKFYISQKSNLHTLNPLADKAMDHVEVKTVDIYEVMRANKDIALIRMDIEGHEVAVLGGAIRAMREFKSYPAILFETHLSKYSAASNDIKKSLAELFEMGYLPKMVTSTEERFTRMRQKGYRPDIVIKTDLVERGAYRNISCQDAIELIGSLGGVRAVFLSR